MPQNNSNPFQRYAYSPLTYGANNTTAAQYLSSQTPGPVFTGADLEAYINNIKVGNLESVTWSISVEVVGNYVMGRRDAVVYTTGKRVVVGSIVFSQYDRHALLEQVFQLTTANPPVRTISDLWSYDTTNVGALLSSNAPQAAVIGSNPTNPVRAGNVNSVLSGVNPPSIPAGLGMRGLTPTDFNNQLLAQLQDTARLVGANTVSYSDQIPPFDLTLVGVNQTGDAARCSIFGMRITQETAGFSQNDLSNSVGMSFVALAVSPWRPVTLGGSTAYVTGQ